MSRQSRTLLVLVGLGLIGLSLLAYMAHRYGKIAERRGPEIEQALAQVERFIVVRRAMRLSLDTGEIEDLGDTLRRSRDQALEPARLDPATYATLRSFYREWKRGKLAGTSMAAAFEMRRAELKRLDLGEGELLDT